ncbi:hypothetical protein HEB94_006881 [Actinopolymorpha pittospori]|uniref:Mutator family transposase n=1 Tax=Actinopolymorpha pittospori TaxID=648752 RepID=A0A927N4A3_9ACTN|nr:hypothetical protein [Actinopolymorpha pittospori]
METTSEQEPAGGSVGSAVTDEQLIAMLVDRARGDGLKLTGEGGLLQQLTKRVLESALDGEITDHVGYDKHDPAGRGNGNTRNGSRTKTVLTDVGPVEVRVPRDAVGTFEPQIVRKRQRRLTGVDDMVLSLSAKGLTHGEIAAHLAEVYGAEVSKQTISTITDKVMDGMAEWQNRPLDRVYPVVFIDAINVKIRDGQVANRPACPDHACPDYRGLAPLASCVLRCGGVPAGECRPRGRVRRPGGTPPTGCSRARRRRAITLTHTWSDELLLATERLAFLAWDEGGASGFQVLSSNRPLNAHEALLDPRNETPGSSSSVWARVDVV